MREVLGERLGVCSDGKNRYFLLVECTNCRKKIWRLKTQIKITNTRFCSSECRTKYLDKKTEFTCANCGKKVMRRRHAVKSNKTGMFFCDTNCKDEAQHIKHLFDKKKKIPCLKCGKILEADHRSSRKLCRDCNPPKSQKKKIDYKNVLEYGGRVSNMYNFRSYLINNGIKKNVCESCNIDVWMGKPIVIHLHHIDGNRFNNKLENLQMACPNCHSQTSTWGNRK